MNKTTRAPQATLVLLFVILVLSGCETTPSAVEENFGSSVRNMIALQTAQPGQRTPSLDGKKGEIALDVYRQDVASPKAAEREIINIQLSD